MGKAYVVIHSWNVYGESGQKIVSIHDSEEGALNGFKDFIVDSQKRGGLISLVLDENLNYKDDYDLDDFEFTESHFLATKDYGELMSKVWIEVYNVKSYQSNNY